MIYFDNAATTVTKPVKVIDEAIYSIKNHGNPGRGGYPLSLNAAQKIFNTRLTLANFFGSYSPERVIFTLNATMSKWYNKDKSLKSVEIRVKGLVPIFYALNP